ncbi:MAG: rod-determining factor RdfA [Halorhabdus sp.]
MDDSTRPNSKVARVIRRYDLDGFGDRIEAAWTGESGDRTSLRNLADQLNRAVLEAAMQDASGLVSESDVESAYRTLTVDDVSRADRRRKRRDLDAMGVDVDAVESDFVTHQTVHNYLTDYRGAELPNQSEGTAQRKAETIERLQGRTSAVTESSVESLTSSGAITDHEYDVVVDVRVICSDCGSDYPAGDLLRDGGCNC